MGDLENWFRCTNLRNAGLISNLSPSTFGYTIIACGSFVEGSAYSLRVRSSAILLLFCASQEVNGDKRKEGEEEKGEKIKREKQKQKVLITKKN